MVAPVADADDRAVAHQRGIERHGDVARRRELAEFRRERRIVVGKRRGKRTDRKPGFERRGVGQFRHERAVDKDQPAAFDVAEQLSRRLGAGNRCGIGRSGKRLGIAHQRAQIGVLPVLDAAMRQALADEKVERGGALFGDRRPAGQPLARLGKGVRQGGLRRRLDDLYFRHGIHSFRSAQALPAYAAASS